MAATSTNGGAGIGGGAPINSVGGSGGNIKITGGIVTATGYRGAGIGGGYSGDGGTVEITGSNTMVTAFGQLDGKDVGSGGNNSSGGSLTVGKAEDTDEPTVELQNNGTNANRTFKNCTIIGYGAKVFGYIGQYDKNGKKTTLEINMPTAQAIYYDSKLSASILSGGTVKFNGETVGGSFAWLDGDTIVTASGNYIAVFTPEKYKKFLVNVHVDVKKIIPWILEQPTASDIPYGSPLSASIISGGKANVPGEFKWEDGNTTLKTSGNYRAIFTPTDKAKYETVKANVYVNVNPLTPVVTTKPTASDIPYGSALSASTLLLDFTA